MKKILFLLGLLSLFFSCKTGTKSKNELIISLERKSSSSVDGTVKFSEKNGFVTLVAKIKGLKPGIHAIHIHEKADCTAADGTSAGGHWNPTFKKHGKFGVGEYHAGDIGNFKADKKGDGTITFKTDQWCIGCDDPTKNILGKGIIVHQGADDFETQPTGNAGARVACSGIIR